MKGDRAKQEIVQKITELFGQTNVIYQDKKLYINTKEDGQSIQIALALSCPKVPVVLEQSSTIPVVKGGFDFESVGVAEAAPKAHKEVEISEEELDNIQKLMARLGL